MNKYFLGFDKVHSAHFNSVCLNKNKPYQPGKSIPNFWETGANAFKQIAKILAGNKAKH